MPQKFVNFPFTHQKYRRDQRMPTGLTPQNDFGVTLQKSSSMGGGGGGIKWNGPFIAQHFKNSNISKIHLCYESKQCAQEQFSFHTLQQRCPG